jgi:hypothetical protein
MLDDLFRAIADTGVEQVYVEHMNLPAYVRGRLRRELLDQPEDVRVTYERAKTEEHREVLGQMVAELVDKHGLGVRFGGAMYHPKMMRAQSTSRSGTEA